MAADRTSIYLPNPIYHQIAFGGILLSGVTRTLLSIAQLSPTTSHPGYIAQKQKVVRTMWTGIFTFVVGFLIWNVDNYFCDQLRRAREIVGPLGFLLQGKWGLVLPLGGKRIADSIGHGYWHLMTGYGSFLIMTASACRSSTSLLLSCSPRADQH